jgi:poly-gamma-glutamate synthesis protein (capsule biosynthesis protein)
MFTTVLLSMAIICALGVLALAAYLFIPFRYPARTESDYTYRNTPWWQIYYSHKYVHPIVHAEKNSGLESYFDGVAFKPPLDKLQNSRTFSLCGVGDLMVRRDLVGPGGEHLWDDVGQTIFSHDLVIGNLECAVNESLVIENLVRFSVPPSFVDVLLSDERFGRVHYVSLGNNHINDSFFEGVRRTCDYLDSIGVMHSGANRTPKEADEFPIFEMRGAKIALLSYSFSTNGIPVDTAHPYSVNVVRWNALKEEDYDDSLIKRHIEIAKSRGANYIICNNHWCVDFEFYPPKRVVERAHTLFEAGVDLVLGHHPHLVGPVDVHRTRDGRQCLAFYSLGSLTTHGLIFPRQRLSQAVEIELEIGEDTNGETQVRPQQVTLIPIFHSITNGRQGKLSRLIKVRDGLEAIRSDEVPNYFTRRDVKDIRNVHAFYQTNVRCAGVAKR